jgi:hypothetical protein
VTFTTDPDAKIGAIAAALAVALGGVDATVLTYDPGVEGVQQFPVVGVGDVAVEQTGLDESGHQLGRRDWLMRWTVRVYVALDDPAAAWASARSLLGQALYSIDNDHTLGGEAREVTTGSFTLEPSQPEETSRRMLVGELEVFALTLMPDPHFD